MGVLRNLGELVPGAEMTFSHQAVVCPSLSLPLVTMLFLKVLVII